MNLEPRQGNRFARALRLFERVFPPQEAGAPYLFPSRVTDDVQLVHPIFNGLLLSGARFGQETNLPALNAGNNSTLLVQPDAGKILFPLTLMIHNPDAAVRSIIVQIATDGTVGVDPWGRYENIYNIDMKEIGVGLHASTFHAPALPRGNRLQIVWQGMTGGNQGQIYMTYVQVPGELVTIDQLLLCRGSIRSSPSASGSP